MELRIEYGTTGQLTWETGADADVQWKPGPAALARPIDAVREALAAPLEYPALAAALVPGDRVVMALDPGLPGLADVLTGIWSVLAEAGIRPEDLLLLQPASLTPRQSLDPRSALPAEIRAAVGWQMHQPAADNSTGYLATSLSGERVYLARELLDADFVLPVGRLGFDPVLGYRGAASLFYPGLSSPDAFVRAHGQGHSELRPEDDRPLRQLIDEAAWLLGVQFGVQVIPSATGIAAVLAGSLEATIREGRRQLDIGWRITQHERRETVLVSVRPAAGPTTWDEVGAALEVARKLVTRGGRIVLLTDLEATPGPGVEMVRNRRSPSDALQPLRRESPPDLVPATQWTQAADWASLYLLSRLESNLAEDLFAIPLENEREVQRLLGGAEDCLAIAGAQFAYGEITDDEEEEE